LYAWQFICKPEVQRQRPEMTSRGIPHPRRFLGRPFWAGSRAAAPWPSLAACWPDFGHLQQADGQLDSTPLSLHVVPDRMEPQLPGVRIVIEENHAPRLLAEAPGGGVEGLGFFALAEVKLGIEVFTLAFHLGRLR